MDEDKPQDPTEPIEQPADIPSETKPKRQKFGGRKKGSLNRKTLQKMVAGEREVAVARQRGLKGRLAIDHMDDMILFFDVLVRETLNPWNLDGTRREGYDEGIWFRAVAAFQAFLNMRAPYQTPRLSALALMPQQAARKTTVNVTILNDKGDKVFADDASEIKTIEAEPMVAPDEEAA